MKFYKESKIGVIIALAIVLLIWGLNFLKGRNLFTSNKQYFAVFSNIGGLKKTSAVSANGYQIGLVSNISFLKGDINKILVELLIDKKFKIPKKSVVQIYSSDLLGSKAVKLELVDSIALVNNEYTKIYAKQNDTLKSFYSGDLSATVTKIKDQAESAISSIDSVATSLHHILTPETEKNIRGAIMALQDLIVTEKQKISQILNNVESITKNFENSNKSISNIVGNLSAVSDSLAAANLKKTIEKANITFTQTSEILTKINSGKGSLGLLVNNDSLYLTLHKTVQDLDSLLVDLNKHPKRYVHLSVFGSKDSKSKK
jgi:phospholipid/cholesterol/gamma-HCH transport system substrate-binding protein